MMKVKTKVCLIIAEILLVACGCSQERVTESEKDSDALFSEQCKLLSTSIDSMARCSDSLAIAELHTHLEKAMAEAAMKHAPQAHLEFSEGKNDTIMRLTDAYLQEYKKTMGRIHPEPVLSETAVIALQTKSEGVAVSKEKETQKSK